MCFKGIKGVENGNGKSLPEKKAFLRKRSISLGVIALLTLLRISSAHADVIINELMYHPWDYWPPAQSSPLTNLWEYIEIYNTSATQAVDLSTYRLENGVSFDFPAGTMIGPTNYLVVCADTNAFKAFYPGVANFIGDYNGTLNNGGERITLAHNINGIWVNVDTIKYYDGGPADGDGPSLELVNPGFASLDDQYLGDWLPSTTTNGSPGRVNTVYTNNPPPVVGDTTHFPILPPANAAVTISARVKAVFTNAPNVVLECRIDSLPQQTNWTSIPMRDDGHVGDAVANDGVYSVMYPPYGGTGMTNGSILEFRIKATDRLSRTYPVTNNSGVLTGPYSYLCYFGTDPYFTGEYPAYHIIMTRANRQTLETRGVLSSIPLECTLITSDGHIFYNSGTRYRGSSTRTSEGSPPSMSYRIELPLGRKLDGRHSWNFNHREGQTSYVAMNLFANTGYSNNAPNAQLTHMWLNDVYLSSLSYCTTRIYCRLETFDSEFTTPRYANPNGNFYTASGDGVYTGDLSYPPNPSIYDAKTNNPHTIWADLTNFCWKLAQPAASYPTVLLSKGTNDFDFTINARQWARHFAVQVCTDNGEAGYGSPWPGNQSGDELRFFGDPSSFMFDIYPWDVGQIFTTAGGNVWGYTHPVIGKFLYNPPITPYFLGDILDVMDNQMSETNMENFFNSMGSIATSKNSWLNTIRNQRSAVHNNINTNLTVALIGGVPMSLPVTVVTTPTISLSGIAPQTYTARVTVNGQNTLWQICPSRSSANSWSTTNALTLSNLVNNVRVATWSSETNLLRDTNLVVVMKTRSVNRSGTISSPTLWDGSGGVNQVISDITIASGGTLTIATDTVVLFNSGTRINVNSGGTLILAGTLDQPVYFLSNTGAWTVAASGNNAVINSSGLMALGGRFDISSGAQLQFTDSTLSQYGLPDGILAANQAAITLNRCVIADYAATYFSGSQLLATQSLFKNVSLAGMILSNTTATVTQCTLRQSTALTPVSAVYAAFSNTVSLNNCMIRDFNGPGVEVNNITNRTDINSTLIAGCGNAVSAINGTIITNRHLTFVSNAVAVAGTAVAVTDSLLWNNPMVFSNGPGATAYCDIEQPGASVYPGLGNMNRQPFFRNAAESDYRLLTNSPCIGNGSGGTTIGCSFPAGATPHDPTGFAITNLDDFHISFAWLDNSTDEETFEIQYSADQTVWQTLANVPANATAYTHTFATLRPSLFYRIRTVHRRGESFFTAAAYGPTTIDDLQANLRITEIMYNPPGAGDLSEFIEFKNVGDHTLNLGGLYMDHNRFSFPGGTFLGPNAFFVLAKSPAGFTNAYPGVTYNGVYLNSTSELDNAGQEIWLCSTNSGTKIISVTYDDKAPWPTAADGNGASLVLINENDPAPYDVSRWRASTQAGGSPGANDLAPSEDGVVINEVMSFDVSGTNDWIELYNPTANPVDLSYWFLSDNLSYTNVRIASGTVIQPGAYMVLTEALHFGTNAAPGGFGLSRTGDTIYLSEADIFGMMSGHHVSAVFGAAEQGISFGRHTRSDGAVDFTAMSTSTPGATNAYPRVGPLVISEIHCRPGGGEQEFVELVNISGTAVSLFQGGQGWRLSDGIDFDFPSNAVVPPYGYVVVSAEAPDVYRAHMAMTTTNILVFGPYTGRLNNEGETITLYKPGAPTLTQIPWITVDHVVYDDVAPWPVATNHPHMSLEKQNLGLYGNDPAYWSAVSPGGTPGEINNTAGLPIIHFAQSTNAGPEANAMYEASVTCLPSQSTTLTATYTVGGTATPGLDHAVSNGAAIFWPYETLRTIPVEIKDDIEPEPDETIVIALAETSTAFRVTYPKTFTFTIHDTDTNSLPPPAITPSDMGFYNSMTISMAPSVSNSTVRYTLDGSLPGLSAPIYTTPVTITSSTRLTARTFLGENAGGYTNRLYLQKTPKEPPGAGIIEQSIQEWSDDAQEWNRGIYLTNTVISLGASIGTSGFRFQNIMLARYTTVTNAYIQFTASTDTYNTVNMMIMGEASGNAAAFTNATKFSLRNKTAATVAWTPANWPNINESGASQRTPNIAPIIQEIVSRTNWQSGNALAIFIRTNGLMNARNAYSSDGDLSFAPVLHVEYDTTTVAMVSLAVSTPFGIPTPFAGTNLYPLSTVVTGSIAGSPVPAGVGTQYVATGWSGSGSVPITGTNLTTGAITLNTNSTINWLWMTNTWLALATAGNGTIDQTDTWVPFGSNIMITAIPDENNDFAGWSGDVPPAQTNDNPLTVAMDQRRGITANFAVIINTNEVSLDVSTPYGTSAPPAGVHMYLPDTVVTSTITGSPVPAGVGTQYVATGWSGDGSVPDSGTNLTTGPVTLSTDSTINWLWMTNTWLSLATVGKGTINQTNTWVAFGSNITFTAIPDAYQVFSSWSGDIAPTQANSNPLTVTMNITRAITAQFSRMLTTNGTPVEWLALVYGTSNTNWNQIDNSDDDTDGLKVWQEYIAGTDPKVRESVLKFLPESHASSQTFWMVWASVTGRVYAIHRSTNMMEVWPQAMVTGLWAELDGTNEYTDTNAAIGPAFYRLNVEYPNQP